MATSAAAGPRGASFELHDQFERLHTVSFPRTNVSVIVFADRKGSEQLDGWIRPIYERYRESVAIDGVAKLKGAPAFMRGWIRGMFRKGVPDYPVMLDWTGRVCEDYGYRPGVANILILRPDGTIEHRDEGAATPAAVETCFKQIDRLLAP